MGKRRRDETVIVGLDVGTTKVCAIVGEVGDDGVTVRAVSSHPSSGLKKGVVIDIEATAATIKKTVDEAAEQAGVAIREVCVGISGSHIRSVNSFGAVGIKGKEVTPDDVERAIDAASAVYVPLDREVLHVLPTDFILDGQDGIKDPVGMAGVRLEVKVYIVTGAVTSVQNLIKCCERAGVEVADIVLQPLASAEATLTPYERDMGIMLVDIGGGTTDIAIYRDSWLRHTAVLGIGGNHFTNDLAVGLRLPFHEAERVKKHYGTVIPSDFTSRTALSGALPAPNGNGEVEVVALDGQVRGIPKKYIEEILHPRGEELLDLIKQEFQTVHASGMAVAGVVLTGGSSLLSGFDRMAEAILSMPVRIGYPGRALRGAPDDAGAVVPVSGLDEGFDSPLYATGIGLVLHGAEALLPHESGSASSEVFGRVMSTMTGWFKKITRKK